MKIYNKRTWLNKPGSRSTGNVVCFDGEITYHGKKHRDTFTSISDCDRTIRLHPTEDDTLMDYIDKLKLLRDDLNLFIYHLCQESKQ